MFRPGLRSLLTQVLLCLAGLGGSLHVEGGQDPDRYFEQGEKAIAENRLDAAAQAYEQLARIQPTVPEVRAKLGLIYYMQGHYAAAVPQLQAAMELNPALPNLQSILAICYAELGRYAEALPGLEKSFHRVFDDKVRRLIGLELLRSYMGLKHPDKAGLIAVELARRYPDDPEILYNTGHVFGDLAYGSMKRLTSVAPDSVWMRQAVGETYEAQGQYALAAGEYRKVIAVDPNRPGIHFRLGHALLLQSGVSTPSEEALEEFRKAYELDVDRGAAYEIGEIYRRGGQLEKARDYFTAATKDEPAFEEAQIGLGRTLVQLSQPAQALPHLQQALKLNPQNEVSHYQLALVYRALGNSAAQQREIEDFRRLHREKKNQQKLLTESAFPGEDVTRQVVDSETN